MACHYNKDIYILNFKSNGDKFIEALYPYIKLELQILLNKYGIF